MRTNSTSLPLVLCLLLSLPLAFAQSEPVTLRLAVADQQGRPSEPYVLEFIKQVETLSNGTITINPIWDAGSDTEAGFEMGVVEHVTAGDFELGLAGSRAWNGAGVTIFDALQAPFLIDNDALAEAVATSEVATRMLEGMSSAGMVGLTLWPEDLRHPFAIPPQTPLLSPEDFAGLNIRTVPSGISYALIEALGGTPMFEGSGYEGAESGLLQGASLTGTPTATGNVVFFPKFQVLFASGGAFERLSDEQQTVLRDAAMATQQKALAEHPQEVDAATAWCADGGTIVIASEEQLAAFEEAAQPVFDRIAQDPMNTEFIAAIRDLKANTSASPGVTACTSTLPDPMYRGTLPPNGVYRMDIASAEELTALGASRGFANANVGSTTWAFEDGTMTMRWESGNQSAECTWTYESIRGVLRMALPPGECTNGLVVLELLWREHADGALEFLLVSTTDPSVQDLVDTRVLFERTWQRVEEWSEGLPPNGVWQVELTVDELMEMGLLRSKAADFAGLHTWTFEDGQATWRIEQEMPGSCEATYEVVEDFVRFTYTSGSDCADEVDDIQWRLEDDGLHLHLVDITGAPFAENKAYLEAKPWQKVE